MPIAESIASNPMDELVLLRSELERLELRQASLLETVRWMRQTVHQAHHSGAMDDCPAAVCRAAQEVLGGEA